jgi:N-methylhydantoinase B/oxoprolinase/acetone carboxylase alpha subunit
MADTLVIFDPTADAGSRFTSPAVRTEIGRTASVEMELADGTVTNPKLAPNAVTADKVATNGIIARNLNANAVTTPKMMDGTVTGAKAGTGTVTSTNAAGSYRDLEVRTLTAAQYLSIDTPDPNCLYIILGAA